MNGPSLRERKQRDAANARKQRFAPHAFAALLRGWQLRHSVGDSTRHGVQSGANGVGGKLATAKMAEVKSLASTSAAAQPGTPGSD